MERRPGDAPQDRFHPARLREPRLAHVYDTLYNEGVGRTNVEPYWARDTLLAGAGIESKAKTGGSRKRTRPAATAAS